MSCASQKETQSWFSLPNDQTDKVQPINQGYRVMMKTRIGDALDRFLDVPENIDLWPGKLSARQRRTLLTKWAGDAWQELSDNYGETRWKLFQHTGCLTTADGTDDCLILPQGFKTYSF